MMSEEIPHRISGQTEIFSRDSFSEPSVAFVSHTEVDHNDNTDETKPECMPAEQCEVVKQNPSHESHEDLSKQKNENGSSNLKISAEDKSKGGYKNPGVLQQHVPEPTVMSSTDEHTSDEVLKDNETVVVQLHSLNRSSILEDRFQTHSQFLDETFNFLKDMEYVCGPKTVLEEETSNQTITSQEDSGTTEGKNIEDSTGNQGNACPSDQDAGSSEEASPSNNTSDSQSDVSIFGRDSPSDQPRTVPSDGSSDDGDSNEEVFQDGPLSPVCPVSPIHLTTINRGRDGKSFHKRNPTTYEWEKVIILSRESTGNFGFHLKGENPVCISSVEAGSIAEKKNICAGDALLSVDGTDVLHLAHKEVIDLISQSAGHSANSTLNLIVAPMRIIQSLVSPTKNGMLEIRGNGLRKFWHKRWFELKEDCALYYFKDQGDLRPRAAIYLKDFSVDPSNEVPNAFRLWKYGLQFMLRASDQETMLIWTEVLNKAINVVSIKKENIQLVNTATKNLYLHQLSIPAPDCTGYLQKQGGRKPVWRKRYCILKDASLYYYADRQKIVAKGVAHFHDYTVVDHITRGHKPHGFTLTPPKPNMREFYFIADNESEKQRWMKAFTESIQKWVGAP